MILAGCDNPKSLESFTPEMASFSNEFDFDPLRGPVKDFSQTLMSENGEVAKQVTGTLSQEGCFDTLELHDLENNTGLALVLDANYYRDAQTLEKGAVTGKCQLAALPSAGVTWETDDNGFVVSATGKEMKVEYRYDSEGYPLGKTTINSQNTLSVTAKPSADPRKSWITRQSAGWMIDRSATSHRAANMMRTRTLLTAGLLSSMRALSRQCPTITPLKIVSITTKPGAVRFSVTTAPRLLRGGFQERRTGRFMFIQILLLEDTHADGVTVFAVNEELMNQLAFYPKPEFTVDVNRFSFSLSTIKYNL